MPKLLVKPEKETGRVSHVTPQSAGWTYVGFDLHRLKPGETVSAVTGDREVCLVFVTGKGSTRAAGKDFGLLGERMSPFEGKPWSLYVPQGSDWSVTAETDLELAVCSAPGLGGGLGARVIAPEQLGREVRGKGTNTRYVTNILPENEPADSLLVVEVITPGGHTSSYPPHKHDRDDLPRESYLEETMAVEDGDVVLVPKGYHPCAACHGYDLYYLNVMAGPKRTWKFYNAPEHEWLLKA